MNNTAEKPTLHNCARCGASTYCRKDEVAVCGSCMRLEYDNAEVDHELMIRCPACSHVEEAYVALESGAMDDGDHELSCAKCGHDYTVRAEVSVNYTSPARIEAECSKTEENDE